ncbi:MAG: class I SAM-dependent methyltransferase [Desulfonatronovibrionaceae bacterium]
MKIENLLVEAGDRTWEISRPDDLESLWSDMDGSSEADEDFIPYWVEVWPAAIFLTEWIQGNSSLLRERHCLDLGCGLGLTALAGAECGARVTATDNKFSALAYGRVNARRNRVREPFWVCTDWRYPGFCPSCFDFVWAADVFYESRFLEPVSELLERVLKPGGRAVFADPDREVSRRAWPWLREAGWEVCSVGKKTVQNSGQKGTVTLRMLGRRNER